MIKGLKFGNLQVIESGLLYGNMNTAKAFYPENYSVEDRRNAFMINRNALGSDYGFDGRKMYMADQKDKTGTYFEITQDYVDANPNGWTDIDQDILVVTDKVPGVVIGHPVADCPVVMACDMRNHVVAIGHCSGDLVDKRLPMSVVDALQDSYGSKDDEIFTYVSACAGNSWTYDRMPKWAQDESFWSKYIKYEEQTGLYRINLKDAVREQLADRNIESIIVSDIDTITDDRFYSNSAAANGHKEKSGRNFAGAYYKKR